MFSKVERDNGLPFVSVVVPTFNRKKLLENCLNSLFKMDYPGSKFEVIVVDGGSTDGTKVMVHRKFPKVRFILEKRKGRSFARNTGWKRAKGQIVAYTDDDCVIDECWLRILVSGFDSREIGGVGGPVFLLLHPKSICERFHGTPVGNFYLGERKILAKELITANLAVRREVFEKNRFDTSLAYDLEDIDFCRSLMEAGYK
ncbi:MAG: glycosyltransferase, partial [archaeon]|nr:glycosyltransferase [archaeon]